MPWPGLERDLVVAARRYVLPGLDVGDAVVVDESADIAAQSVESGASPPTEDLGDVTPRLPDIACGVDELVKVGGGATPPAPDLEQRLLGARRTVSGEHTVWVGLPGVRATELRLGGGQR